MRTRRFDHSLFISLAILRTAAFLVPTQRREDWLAEWKSELWYVRQMQVVKPGVAFDDRADTVGFCLGAFKDGFWLRRYDSRSVVRRAFRIGSPSRCVFLLAVLAGISLSLALYLPGARKAILPSPYRDADSLVTISRKGYSWAPFPTVKFAEYRSLKRKKRLITGIAFYRPVLKQVQIARHKTAELSLALASDNLFELLQIPIESSTPKRANHDHSVELVLSQEAWRKYFNANPDIGGRFIDVAGQRIPIAGVAVAGSWRLPGKMDGWLLEDPHRLAGSLSSHSTGYVLAQVGTPGFSIPSDGEFEMTVAEANGDLDRYGCLSLAERNRQPFFLFLFALALACLSLPATTALPLGEYPVNKNRLPWTTSIRRWLFLLTKIALIVPVVYFVSIDLAYFSHSIPAECSLYIQLGSSFLAFLFAFRWALRDQRKRCPVCLRLLTNPARVGQSSRNFLAWNGTELICVQGHGLLHVPEISTSWFSTQRWLYLDPSWNGLFSSAYLGTL